MSTTRTISNYIDQRTLTLVNNLQVRQFRAHIIDVLFPGHSFAVVAPGYSGPSEVPADPSIDFGTTSRPLVFRGNDCIVQMDANGMWHATQYIATTRCVPTTNPNAPNVALPTYTPPKDSITTFDIPRVDATFQPPVLVMGQISTSAKMPRAILPSGSSGTGSRAPVLMAQYPYLPSSFVQSLTGGGIVIQGNLCVIQDYARVGATMRITILDVTNPAIPIILSQTTAAGAATASPKVSGKYLYIIGSSAPQKIFIYDISNPYSPSLTSTTNMVSNDLWGEPQLFSVGTSTYMATQEFTGTTAHIRVYDLTNAAAPAGLVGDTTAFPGGVIDSDFSTFCDGVLYTMGSTYIAAFDMSAPSIPVYLGGYSGQQFYGQMVANHKTVYIADENNPSNNRIYVLNFTTPASPTLTTSFHNAPTDATQEPIGMWVDGHYLYVNTCGNPNRLFIWDVSVSTSPVLVGQCNIANRNCPSYGMAVSGNHAFWRGIGEMTYGLNAPILEIAGF